MKSFEYAEPRTEEEAVEFLQDAGGTAVVLAGGTDLMGLMKKMVVTPDRVVNIMEVDSLKEIRPLPDGSLAIGSAVTLDELLADHHLADYGGILDAIHGINSMQLQSQGTLGGEVLRRPQCWYFRRDGELLDGRRVTEGDNRYHAILGNQGPAKFVSASRIAPCLIALGAQARIRSAEGERWCDVADLFQIPRRADQHENTLAPGELVTHFVLPPAGALQSATYEVRHGAGPDMPLAAAAAVLEFSGGRVKKAHVVMGQVAPIPWRADAAAEVLVGHRVDERLAAEAGRVAVAQATPLSHNEYKVQLAQTAVRRAVLRAAGLETGGF